LGPFIVLDLFEALHEFPDVQVVLSQGLGFRVQGSAPGLPRSAVTIRKWTFWICGAHMSMLERNRTRPSHIRQDKSDCESSYTFILLLAADQT
jgi:hypothetical protein